MKPKAYTDPLERMKGVCARREKSPAEVLTLLKRWGLDDNQSQEIIQKLKAEKFIDESRYASAFVRDKFRFEHWGLIKIKYGLIQKGIAKPVAEKALATINQKEYQEMIRNELIKKRKLMKNTAAECWQKLARFGTSRGYEMEIMHDMLDDICEEGR